MVDPAFTSERVTLSEGSDESMGKISKESQKKFEGFTFIPEADLDYKK